jgi:dCTP deaminase
MILTKEQIIEAMNRPLESRLLVTPILDPQSQIGDSSIDMRLGNEFILIRKQTFGSLDISNPSEIEMQIGKYQEKLRIEMRKRFILHPNQLVLGSTLEYVRIPDDIACYVIGRSSWGRLGLLIATATAVAPNFKGCITLELINMGEVPLVLYPGIRIAQLVLHSTIGTGSYTGRYKYPTGPQFSRVHDDTELAFWCPRQTQ